MMSTNTYQSFLLNLESVSVSISHDGDTLNPESGLSRVTSLKNSALAMATGYCVFLNLTDIADDLKAAGAADDLVNQILAGENVNQWVATSFQETSLKGGIGSGFYQIDNAPSAIADNAPSGKAPYFSFLSKLKGGAGDRTAKINQDTEQGFVWQSAEKGYYEAVSYLRNTTAYHGVPTTDFCFAQWAVNYAQHQQPTHAPLPASEHEGVDIGPAMGFEQTMSYMYNRGQFPFVYPDKAPGKYLVPLFKNNGSIAEVMPYNGEDWGLKYVWQLPWLCTLLNGGSNPYTVTISQDDVTDFLQKLTGFFTGGDETGEDSVVNAGIEQAKGLNWGDAYNASSTFANLNKVVQAMMKASQEG